MKFHFWSESCAYFISLYIYETIKEKEPNKNKSSKNIAPINIYRYISHLQEFSKRSVQRQIHLDYIIDLTRDVSPFSMNWRVQLRP